MILAQAIRIKDMNFLFFYVCSLIISFLIFFGCCYHFRNGKSQISRGEFIGISFVMLIPILNLVIAAIMGYTAIEAIGICNTISKWLSEPLINNKDKQ